MWRTNIQLKIRITYLFAVCCGAGTVRSQRRLLMMFPIYIIDKAFIEIPKFFNVLLKLS